MGNNDTEKQIINNKITQDDEKVSVTRRDLLKGISLALTGVATFTLVPNFVFAARSSKQREFLAAVCNTIYPHKKIPNKFYLACAQGLIDKSAKDKNLQKVLLSGQKSLNKIFNKNFTILSKKNRLRAVQRMTTSNFFSTVRGHTVVGLYNLPGVWKYFGYEGPSFPKGGYLKRGFNDISWL